MPNSHFVNDIREFHKTFGLTLDDSDPSIETMLLRFELISEEYAEVGKAFATSLVDKSPEVKRELAKELIDLLYVTVGALEAFGMPTDVLWNRVHRSNMSKLAEDGSVIYSETGKALKGPNYQSPNFEDIIN